MSQHTNPITDRRETLGLESGLKALRESPAFRGPVEPLDGHDSNDHLALVYETRDEQFSAAVPFMRQGLERGERCLYIADENSREAVLTAMRERGVDVDAALESGALTLHTKQDTYCRNGYFDPDDMIAFIADQIDQARDEYGALRITGEMTWIFGDDPEIDDLVEYEAKLNRLLPGKDGIALCQYNRERFPPEVLRDIVRTHPHLIYDSTVCHNAYYTPPEEFFGPDRPAREIDRILNSLRDRTTATVKLSERERALRRQNDRLESFASMLAHELRNPLSIAQIYHQQAVDGDERAAEEVARALDRIEEMIDVLLVTARSTDSVTGGDPVDIAAAAEQAWADVSTDAATLVVDTDRTVETDPVHLRHLLQNLFANAVEHGSTSPRSQAHEDAVEHGSTSRPPEADDVHQTESDAAQQNPKDSADAVEHAGAGGQSPGVTVRVGDLDDGDGFFVEDDGPGIPAEERDSVFEAGYTTEDDGIGLGLTFVAQLADTYDWEYAVTESPAGGARFEFSDASPAAPDR